LNAKILVVPTMVPETAKRQYRRRGTNHISPCQADSIIEAARYAGEIGLLPNAHCTIMWNGTGAFTDTDGKLLAKVREGLNKALARRGIQFAAVWVREARPHKGEHAHMVFHLPSKWRKAGRRAEIERVIERLVDRHGGGLYGDWTVDLRNCNGDVRYLLKGGTREVRSKYKVKRKFAPSQGIIFGKRCGATQNIGPKSRERWGYG